MQTRTPEQMKQQQKSQKRYSLGQIKKIQTMGSKKKSKMQRTVVFEQELIGVQKSPSFKEREEKLGKVEDTPINKRRQSERM